MEDFGGSLLKKQYYHENCPGCKVDQAKELKKRCCWNTSNIVKNWIRNKHLRKIESHTT
ncbi:hypothetical protein MTR_3g010840 [Medicago truncatula]|uniref:Uncharacterized protein n=1 Tax=Medicago truncatula TaxID=3880 RepID=G7IVI2_MEDTR|nr:hypothetical protein MTR_3g010840 [Medicago truncatula]